MRWRIRRGPLVGRLVSVRFGSNGGRASQAIYCASVSPSLRYVSSNVRLTLASVSRNVRRKRPSIARLPHFDCAPLQLAIGQFPRDRPELLVAVHILNALAEMLLDCRPPPRVVPLRDAERRTVVAYL